MALKQELMASSLPYNVANKLGFDPNTAFTAAGTTQGTATLLTANNVTVTTSSIGAGVILGSSEQEFMIFNAGPNVLTVYPPVGVNFAGLATNVGVTIAVNSTVVGKGGGLSGLSWSSGQ